MVAMQPREHIAAQIVGFAALQRRLELHGTPAQLQSSSATTIGGGLDKKATYSSSSSLSLGRASSSSSSFFLFLVDMTTAVN